MCIRFEQKVSLTVKPWDAVLRTDTDNAKRCGVTESFTVVLWTIAVDPGKAFIFITGRRASQLTNKEQVPLWDGIMDVLFFAACWLSAVWLYYDAHRVLFEWNRQCVQCRVIEECWTVLSINNFHVYSFICWFISIWLSFGMAWRELRQVRD